MDAATWTSPQTRRWNGNGATEMSASQDGQHECKRLHCGHPARERTDDGTALTAPDAISTAK